MVDPDDGLPEPDDEGAEEPDAADPTEDDDRPDEVPPFEAARYMAGIDFTSREALRLGIGNIDFKGIEAARRAVAGFDFTGYEAIRRATGMDVTGIGAVFAATQAFERLGIGNIDFTGIDARRAADFAGLLGGIDFAKLFDELNITDLDGFYPPNWPPNVALDTITEVINDDGIPIVWVPRESIVEQVLAAGSRPERIAILLEHSADVAADCRAVLDEITEPTLAGQVPLAVRALEAIADGHLEAAQALATVVTETVVAGALSGKYEEVKKVVRFDHNKVPWTRLRLAAALGPIHRFYTPWFKSSGAPAPEGLSRHVTVHGANVSHYTPGNALVAVLLVTSVLRAIQEWQEGARRDGGGPEEEAA
jgi:hypothetical protein